MDVESGSQIWGKNYDLKFSEIFTAQEEIVRSICERLSLKLTGEQQQRLTNRYTQDTDAYDLYLKGLYAWNKRREEDVRKGIAHFTQAIAKDPNYALAYVGLANSYVWTANAVPPREAMLTVKAMATKALQLNDSLAEAHTALAAVNHLYEWNWSEAESEFKRAIALNPNYPISHQWYAEFLTAMGRHNEAIAEIKQALDLDPRSLIITRDVGWHYFCARQYDRAIEQCQKTLEKDPNFAQAYSLLGLAYVKKGMFAEGIEKLQKALELSSSNSNRSRLGYAYALAGRMDEAQQALDTLNELAKKDYVPPYLIAVVYGGLGDKEQAFARLDNAYDERFGHLTYLKVNPTLDGLRPDPRFRDLMRRVKLPD
jgi:tetratricopeptide (TPR) repeat protein